MAAAIGAGMDITEPVGRMVVESGGGTTDIVVLSMGGVAVSESIRVAGNRLDEAIARYVRKEYGVLIGAQTAQTIKMRIGALYSHRQVRSVEVRGRSAESGLPVVITLSSREMLEAMAEPVSAILDAICSVIERTPPELLGDIMTYGMVLTGGNSLIYGFDHLIHKVTGVPVRVAEDPLTCVVKGTGMALRNYRQLTEGAIHLTRERRERL